MHIYFDYTCVELLELGETGIEDELITDICTCSRHYARQSLGSELPPVPTQQLDVDAQWRYW